MATRIKDIADRANVSQATVSLALNSKPGVSAETRERIVSIAKELEYGTFRKAPRSTAASGTIRFLKIATHGHTVNRDHNVFISDYIDGLARAARVQGYNLEISSFRGTTVDEIRSSIEGHDLKGIVILGTELTSEEIRTFADLKVPTVILDTYFDYLDFDFVDMNNTDAVHKIVTHLVEKGHREIGLVRSSVRTNNFHLRDKGFREAVAEIGLSVSDGHVFSVDSTYDGAYRDMLALLKGGARLPTALFCTNDVIAYGVMRALRDRKVTIPGDVSIVGFDDLPSSSLMDPALTTMKVSKRQMGELAMELVIRRSLGESTPPVKIVVSGTLVERASVRDISAVPTRIKRRAPAESLS